MVLSVTGLEIPRYQLTSLVGRDRKTWAFAKFSAQEFITLKNFFVGPVVVIMKFHAVAGCSNKYNKLLKFIVKKFKLFMRF